jgi:hypothetical protein
MTLFAATQRLYDRLRFIARSYSGLIKPMACHRSQKLTLDAKEEFCEDLLIHAAKHVARKVLVRPTFLPV